MRLCETCRFFDLARRRRFHDPKSGWCRRYAPRAGFLSAYDEWEWPVVQLDAWCGEWEKRDTDSTDGGAA